MHTTNRYTITGTLVATKADIPANKKKPEPIAEAADRVPQQ